MHGTHGTNRAILGCRVIQKQEDLTRNVRNTRNETVYRPEKSLHFFVNDPDTDFQNRAILGCRVIIIIYLQNHPFYFELFRSKIYN
jgi:hypothetical protein